jgi:hypothetical protein
MYYTVKVDGESRNWLSLEYALGDLFSRGFGKEWDLKCVSGDYPA